MLLGPSARGQAGAERGTEAGLNCDRKVVPTRGPVWGPKRGTKKVTEVGAEKPAHVDVTGVFWVKSSVPLLQFFP